MKKTSLLVLGLFAVVLLVGCGKSKDDQNLNVSEGSYVYGINDIYGKSSFTLEDLDIIKGEFLPSSYYYYVYKGDDEGALDSGEFTYPSNHDFLLIEEINIKDRELISSTLKDGQINSLVNVVFWDGSEGSILYINDAETLKYSAASVSTEANTILYTFIYD